MRERTVSIQSPGLPTCSPLPTVAKASGVAPEAVVAPVNLGAGLEEDADDFGVAEVGGAVQRLLAEPVAGLGGEPEIEH